MPGTDLDEDEGRGMVHCPFGPLACLPRGGRKKHVEGGCKTTQPKCSASGSVHFPSHVTSDVGILANYQSFRTKRIFSSQSISTSDRPPAIHSATT